jgi:hypothetical protein
LASNVDILVDDIYIGKANFNNFAIPNSCSDSGFSTFQVTQGSHKITYSGFTTTGNAFNYYKYITMTVGGCVKLNCN